MRRVVCQSFLLLGACATAALLSSCGTTGGVARHLPAYQPPIAKAQFQTVHTTAYTHTESDHREFTNHNALGGELHAAGPPVRRAENTREVSLGYENPSNTRVAAATSGMQPFSFDDDAPKATKRGAKKIAEKRAVVTAKAQPARIGSAAADWARWPAGTTFRLLSTGQIYRVDDYGWALAGRNTIDLYMPSSAEMNSWGARDERIEVLQWGDPQESLRRLQAHQDYKHIRRMVLELRGQDEQAAQLQ